MADFTRKPAEFELIGLILMWIGVAVLVACAYLANYWLGMYATGLVLIWIGNDLSEPRKHWRC